MSQNSVIQLPDPALRLAAIVQSSDDAIVSKDLNGIVKTWNPAAERIFGWKAQEIIGKSILTIIPPELHSDEDLILSKIRLGERIEHFETVRVKKDGERINVSLTVSPVKDADGKVIGAAKIARDITQHKQMEAALRTSERLASMGRMAATVAHEINNPLEAVTNFIYLARFLAERQPGLSPDIVQYLNAADQELARVAHIAQQTLGFYRDNSHPAQILVRQLVEEVVAIYRNRLASSGVTVKLDIKPELAVFSSEGELKQIFSNLFANAIDASQRNGKIIVRAREVARSGSRGLRLSVADRGTGIKSEHRKKIFQPFFTTRKELGTGLGLWITKDLLEKKGGSLRFRSRTDAPSGTVMSLYIPAATAPEQVAEQAA